MTTILEEPLLAEPAVDSGTMANPLLSYPLRRTWTGEEFMRAADMGFFPPDERLELIEGEIIRKMTQKGPHASAVYKIPKVFERIFGVGFMVRAQSPLTLSTNSQPEPDIAVVSGNEDDYVNGHPTTAILVVEVSDTTLALDRSAKAALYARAQIQEYWIVNLVDRVLEVHRQPAAMANQLLGHHYRSVTRHTEADSISPVAAPSDHISIAALLPRRLAP